MSKESYINSVNLNQGTDFPYLVLDVANGHSYPRNPGFQVMHWHEDLQFIYVLDGTVEVKTLDNTVRLHTSEGLFINENVVHYVGSGGNCHYKSFLFPSYFLTFYAGSPAKAYVDCITANEQLPIVHFTSASDWHRDILSALQQLVQMEEAKNEFYEYEVLVRLSTLWLTMRKNIQILPEKKENITNLRIQKILRYIEKHYTEPITLTDMARSANISKSECSRCFRTGMGTTPYKYLTEYRLAKAAGLLKTTNEPIGNICAAVGFHQMSHFGKCFKEKTGLSPRDYRKKEGHIKP